MISNKLLLATLFCIIFCQGFAQTKTVKRMLSPYLTESYTVLKSDKHVKDGNYMVTDADKHILVLGQYKMAKRTVFGTLWMQPAM